MTTFSRGQTVYLRPSNLDPETKFEVGKFLRYDARGNVVVEGTNDSLRFLDVLAIDKRIGLPVEVTFPAENCG